MSVNNNPTQLLSPKIQHCENAKSIGKYMMMAGGLAIALGILFTCIPLIAHFLNHQALLSANTFYSAAIYSFETAGGLFVGGGIVWIISDLVRDVLERKEWDRR